MSPLPRANRLMWLNGGKCGKYAFMAEIWYFMVYGNKWYFSISDMCVFFSSRFMQNGWERDEFFNISMMTLWTCTLRPPVDTNSTVRTTWHLGMSLSMSLSATTPATAPL